MADLTMDDMTVGAIVWDLEYPFKARGRVARKVQVLGPCTDDGYIPMLDCASGGLFKLFPGDRGIAPLAYDKRVTQVFRMKEEAETACKAWDGMNPNFIEKEES